MAKYKAVLGGEIQMYTDIENELMDLAACKGKAFEDSSIEESEREIDDAIEAEKVQRDDSEYDGRRSYNSELLDSIRSENDYWQKLEDKSKRART